VSFSGIDGAGKSTQIDALRSQLSEAGVHVRVLRFWDDIAVLGRAREYLSHALFKSEKGVGAPGRPVQRRDKNVQTWYMTPARFFLYFLDALSLSATVTRISTANAADIVILDRYLYDELANLSLRSRITRAYVRLLLKLIPCPDIAYLLDADPAQAHERKPEYQLDFVNSNRASYLALSALAGGITLIPPLAAEEITRKVLREISQRLREDRGLCSPDFLTNT
jgi:thymidylate kinase